MPTNYQMKVRRALRTNYDHIDINWI